MKYSQEWRLLSQMQSAWSDVNFDGQSAPIFHGELSWWACFQYMKTLWWICCRYSMNPTYWRLNIVFICVRISIKVMSAVKCCRGTNVAYLSSKLLKQWIYTMFCWVQMSQHQQSNISCGTLRKNRRKTSWKIDLVLVRQNVAIRNSKSLVFEVVLLIKFLNFISFFLHWGQ